MNRSRPSHLLSAPTLDQEPIKVLVRLSQVAIAVIIGGFACMLLSLLLTTAPSVQAAPRTHSLTEGLSQSAPNGISLDPSDAGTAGTEPSLVANKAIIAARHQVTGSPDLQITKFSTHNVHFHPGGAITYTIVVSNSRNATSTDAHISEA